MTKLIPVSGLKSIYRNLDVKFFNNKGQRGNYVTPDMADALHELNSAVKQHGGQLLIIDLYRSIETQRKARESYEAGLKPYVAKPGQSFHNAGRAVDIDVKQLNFPIPRDQWLQKLWDLAKPIGFFPVVKSPDIDASEAWHFDLPGPFTEAYLTLPYAEVAAMAVADLSNP